MMHRNKSGTWVLGALGGLLALLLMSGGMVGRDAPEFTLRGAYGGTIDKASLRGKPVLLMFWTASCSICRRELPVVDRMAWEFERNGVEIVAVNLDGVEGAREALRGFRLTNAIDESRAAARAFKVTGVPKFVLIDGKGKVRREAAGYQPEGALREWLRGVAPR